MTFQRPDNRILEQIRKSSKNPERINSNTVQQINVSYVDPTTGREVVLGELQSIDYTIPRETITLESNVNPIRPLNEEGINDLIIDIFENSIRASGIDINRYRSSIPTSQAIVNLSSLYSTIDSDEEE